MDSKHQDLADVIRRAFQKTGKSIKWLADLSGVPYSSVHGLLVDGRDSTISTASRLCVVLGLELKPTPKKRKR